jgi:hypothetical protein
LSYITGCCLYDARVHVRRWLFCMFGFPPCDVYVHDLRAGPPDRRVASRGAVPGGGPRPADAPRGWLPIRCSRGAAGEEGGCGRDVPPPPPGRAQWLYLLPELVQFCVTSVNGWRTRDGVGQPGGEFLMAAAHICRDVCVVLQPCPLMAQPGQRA